MDEPYCPKCGQKMRLVSFLPAENDLPSVEGFRCDRCGEELTREVEVE
jgi:predicted RNA-binding Zn-ribbon protein involved in translation (DUF1610 family)